MKNILAKRYQNAPVSLLAGAVKKENWSDMIDLSIGDTDFVTDERITRAAMADALAGHTHYTNPQGDAELIEAIRADYLKRFAMPLERDEVFVSASSCFGMALSLMAILDPGDEVLLFSPYFFPYKEQVELAGGVPVEVPTYEEDGWAIDPKRLEAAITPKTRALILNNPCNPTGAAYDMATYKTVAMAAQKHDLIVLVDEIYTDYMYQIPFVPFRGMPAMAERTITLNSFSKNYIMTGWRVGCIIAPPAVVSAIKGINENLVYSAPSISQRAALHALELRDVIRDTYTAVYKDRVFYTAKRINQIPGLSVREPQGTFYLFMNIRGTGLTSMEFCQKVRQEAHVAMVPGNAFGSTGEGYVRIACTVTRDKLGEAFDRIAAIKF